MTTQPTPAAPGARRQTEDLYYTDTHYKVTESRLILFGLTADRPARRPADSTWVPLFRLINSALMNLKNPRIVIMSKRKALGLFRDGKLTVADFANASEAQLSYKGRSCAYVQMAFMFEGRELTCVILDVEDDFFDLMDEVNDSRGAAR